MIRNVFAIIFLTTTFYATAAVWNGAGDGENWFDPDNWEPSGVPGAGAHVTVAAGANIILANETSELASFTMNGGALTFSNWATRIQAGTVAINEGTLTLPAAFTNNGVSNRVWIVCAGDFYLGTEAVIDALGRGYAPGHGPGVPEQQRHGAGHGGKGGRSNHGEFGLGGIAYGVSNAPVEPGSGARLNTSYGYQINNGGGVVIIQAGGKITIDGEINADGGSDVHGYVGGGSGGSIYLVCDSFAGSASGCLSARGGDVHNSHNAVGGAGAGGRIAVNYDSLDPDCAIRFIIKGGWSWIEKNDREDNKWWVAAEDGTLWLPDLKLLPSSLTQPRFDGARLYIGNGCNEYSVASLTFEQNNLTLAQSGFKVIVTNDAVIGANARLTIGTVAEPSMNLFNAGSLTIEDGGILKIFSGEGNEDGFGAELAITGALSIGNGSWLIPVAHPYDGGTVQCTANSLTIAAGGGINANGRGYSYGYGDGRATKENAGAGYGGRGGVYHPRSDMMGGEGLPYGNISAPRDPGSGNCHSLYGRNYGGGAIWLEIDGTATIDGSLTAEGGNANHGHISGGSGGGVYLRCGTFAGAISGLILVDGGSAERSTAGGGGRIAVDYDTLDPDCAVRFSAGAGIRGANGQHVNLDQHWWWLAPQDGTLYLPDAQLLDPVMANERFINLRLIIPEFDQWTVDNLDLSDVSFALEDETGNAVPVTVNGDIIINNASFSGIGALTCIGNVMIANNSGLGLISASITGDLILADGSSLSVFAQATNGLATSYGSEVRIDGSMSVTANSWVYPFCHSEDGGAPCFFVHNLTVDSSSGFNANSRGFQGGKGQGFSPSAYAGAGYGGHGGADYTALQGGVTYGSCYGPVKPGSGTRESYQYGIARGGGVIWIEAKDTIAMDGMIHANGGPSSVFHGYPGGGAGGGIFLIAREFSGNESASIHADGGSAGPDRGGGGGGGRIAVLKIRTLKSLDALIAGELPERVIEVDNAFGMQSTFSVAGGTGWADKVLSENPEDYAQPGSKKFLFDPPYRMSIFKFR